MTNMSFRLRTKEWNFSLFSFMLDSMNKLLNLFLAHDHLLFCLTGLTGKHIDVIEKEIEEQITPSSRGRPPKTSLREKIIITLIYLRINCPMRVLSAVWQLALGTIHDIINQTTFLIFFQRSTPIGDGVVDGTLIPVYDSFISNKSKNYRYCGNSTVIIDPRTKVICAVGHIVPGNMHDSHALPESGLLEWWNNLPSSYLRHRRLIADGGYQGTCAHIPHRKPRRAHKKKSKCISCGHQPIPVNNQPDLTPEQLKENRRHRQVRARIEHVFQKMKHWTILRNCRRRSGSLYDIVCAVARLYNLRYCESIG